ncbi:hypothetical protein [Bradyrhizobium sp. RDM4]|uniref:hypothetical protein n=1 Tax=Bradyrhizobium sp. RDM4 TaxID=3378765 RepID=UPI0038FCF8A3
MIQVLQIPFDKEKLRALSKDERAALFLFGYVTNQLLMMEKLITFATNKESADELESHAKGVQTQMLLRLMIGLVNEAFRAVESRFSSSPIAKEYIILLDAGGKTALKALNKQFGTSILRQLRANFAFHHPSTDDIDAAFAKAANDPAMDSEWNWYLSQHGYNTLFYLSDVVITHAIFEEMKETDWKIGQEKIMKEVTDASNSLKEFTLSFVKAIWLKHFGTELPANKVFVIKEAPAATDVVLPFFVSVPGLQPIRDGVVFR